MSFILDALKKAERERKLGNVPSIDATLGGLTASSRGSRWPTIIAVGLIANAVVLGALYAYWQYGDDRAATQADSSVPLDSPPKPGVEMEPVAKADPLETQVATPISQQAAETTVTALVGNSREERLPQAFVEAEPLQEPPATSTPEVSTAPEPPQPPLLDNLPADVRRTMPRLELTVHVYSDTPSQRFIFVNNRRYGEGDNTQEGAHVERIQPDGIVLSYQGHRFFLPGRW